MSCVRSLYAFGDLDGYAGALGGLKRRDFLKFCTGVAATLGLSPSFGIRIAEAATAATAAAGHLAFRAGMHRLHRVAAARASPDGRDADPRHDLARLPRDLVRRRRPSGRSIQGAVDEAELGQVRPRRRRLDPDPRRRRLLHGRRPADPRHRQGDAPRAPPRSSPSARARRGAASRRATRTRPRPSALHEILPGKTVINIPGCPPNVYNFLSTVLYLVTFGKPPELDDEEPAEVRLRPADPRELRAPAALRRRPLRAGVRRRRATARAGASTSSAARGRRPTPIARRSCSATSAAGAWPVGTGHPCFGCTEQGVGFTKPIHTLANVLTVTPPTAFPRVAEDKGQGATAGAAALAGAVGGAAIGAGAVLATRLGKQRASGEKAFEPSAYDDKSNPSA